MDIDEEGDDDGGPKNSKTAVNWECELDIELKTEVIAMFALRLVSETVVDTWNFDVSWHFTGKQVYNEPWTTSRK